MAFRLCSKCDKAKSANLFNWRNKALGLKHFVCKECHAKYRREHYHSKRNLYIAKAKKWNDRQRLILRKIIFNYLSNNSCIDCGENNIVVLDFDHRENKTKGIAEMIKSCYSADKLMSEISKCDIRCANCHRRETAKKLGYWKMGV